MATQVQRRGGTTTEHGSFTGADREITVDTSKKASVVHDGSQAGGYPQMREDADNEKRADASTSNSYKMVISNKVPFLEEL